MKHLLFIFLALVLSTTVLNAENYPVKKVLILVEGSYDITSKATGQGRELAQLLGHFNTVVTIDGTSKYKSHDIEKYDYLFYVGFSPDNQPPANLSHDIMVTSRPVIWINTGFLNFCEQQDVLKRFGFRVVRFEKNGIYNAVKSKNYLFDKGSTDINMVEVKDKKAVEIWATAVSTKTKGETPYMLKSKNLTYVADLPTLGAEVNDRYLLFCDKLHDILNEKHSNTHNAIIRIEDVTPVSNPDKLREVADILSERGIPFLVAVVPIYVNPVENLRIPLSERPEVVDALKYMVQNGGSIVMHGATHQYKGISTDDGEFWDAANATPIPGENTEDFRKKIELGIDEFVKNGLHPVAWETPHYMSSVKFLKVISKFFSTVVEQRMVIDNFDYGQSFPFLIKKDLYGQKIFPENLGYVPLSTNAAESKAVVQRLIKSTDGIRQVRDGIATCFFHPFLDLDLLKTLVDGITAKGFTFIDLKEQPNWVKSHDKVILNGSQAYTLTIDNSYLHELYYDAENKLIRKSFTEERLKGPVTKKIQLKPGETYVAEAVDYHFQDLTLKDKVIHKFDNTYQELFGNKDWREARVKIIWNPAAKGAAYFDQSSLAAIFKSVNINVDTLFVNEGIDFSNCNLLIVPFTSADLLNRESIKKIQKFLHKGGNLITDRNNNLIRNLDMKFTSTQSKLQLVRDKYYPEEPISWRSGQLVYKFDYDVKDEIFCEDASNGFPVVIGKEYGAGKIIYFNTAFDPLSPNGYSYYPYAMEYIRRFMWLQPVFKRESLEMYFDPGFRHNTSEEELVKRWVKQGIRIIHVSAWHQYPKYSYDYKHLIRLAHANGILVYAWLEPPQVSLKFWTEHPEWREKNYLNQVIHQDEIIRPSWRYPVALTDKDCLKASIAVYINLLKNNDFDGVNLAELYFEAGRGFSDPKLFTPMHPSAVKEFYARYGYNLKEIFNAGSPFYWKNHQKVKEDVMDYRVKKVTELHETILAEIKKFAKTRKGFTTVVTFFDTHFSPEITEYHGVNSDKLLDLQKKYDFMAQIEDPQNKWSTDPYRYVEMGKYYAKKVSDSSKIMLDLNILNFRGKDEVTPFPTLMQTGIESYQLINAASIGAQRFTVYSESSCNPQDLSFFSYASSGPVHYTYTDDGYQVSSPYSFVLQLPKNIKSISVDGRDVVGYRDNLYTIPAGKHNIKLQPNEIPGFSTGTLQPEILSFTGNLLDVGYDMRRMIISYQSNGRALASFNNKPTKIMIDGANYDFEVLRGNDCFTVMLPAGSHHALIETGNSFSYGINLTSLWSMSAIAIYGVLATISLIFMFVALKFIRRQYEA